METIEFDGPYFLGQEPEACGHYHPDVLLIEDSLNDGSKLKRTTFCFKCNKPYNEDIPTSRFSESFLKEVRGKDKKVYGTLEELAKFRGEKLKSFLLGNDW